MLLRFTSPESAGRCVLCLSLSSFHRSVTMDLFCAMVCAINAVLYAVNENGVKPPRLEEL